MSMRVGGDQRPLCDLRYRFAYATGLMAENIFYWLVVLNLIAGFWFVYAIVATQLRQRKKRRYTRVENKLSETPQHRISPIVKRGYDHPQLFYDDALLRLRALEREVAKDNRDLATVLVELTRRKVARRDS